MATILNSMGEPIREVGTEVPDPTGYANSLGAGGLGIPFGGLNSTGLPNFFPGDEQTLSQWNTLFDNLRYYLLSNNRQLISYCIAQIGLIRTICDVPVADALRGGIEIKTEQLNEQQVAQLMRLLEEKKDLNAVGRTMSKVRGFGGGGVVILTDQDPKTPLDMNAINERTPIEFKPADMWELFWDIPDTGEYDPSIAIENVEMYRWYNVSVHKSRVMPMVGIEAPSFLRPRLRGWGLSELEILVRGVNQFLKSQNVTFEVLDEFKIDVYKIKNLLNSLLTPIGQANVRNRIILSNQIKNFQKALVMDSEDDFDHKQLTFAGIPEIMAQFRIQICADMRMPMTKLFGISFSGLSSTDEGDFEVYNGMIESEVRGKIKSPIMQVVKIRCQQLFGFVPDDLTIDFKPLSVLSAEGEEKVKDAKFNRIFQAVQANKITDKEFRERCNHDNLLGKPLDIDSVDLNPDELKEEEVTTEGKPAKEVPEIKKNALQTAIDKFAKISQAVDNLKHMLKMINEFDESKHPRAEDGKFGKGGGGASKKETPAKRGLLAPAAASPVEKSIALSPQGPYKYLATSKWFTDKKGTDVSRFEVRQVRKMAVNELRHHVGPKLAQLKEDFAKENIDVEIQMRAKTTQSLDTKMKTKWSEKTLSSATDLIGTRLVFKNDGDIHAAIPTLEKKLGMKCVEDDDFLDQGKPGGYRAVHLLFKSPNGVTFEMQIQTPLGRQFQQFAHKIYKLDHEYSGVAEGSGQHKEAKQYSEAVGEWIHRHDIGEDAGPKPEAPNWIESRHGQFDFGIVEG